MKATRFLQISVLVAATTINATETTQTPEDVARAITKRRVAELVLMLAKAEIEGFKGRADALRAMIRAERAIITDAGQEG